MAIWSALPFLILSAGGLVVDTSSPDSFCPALEQTRQVVASRLGTVELEGTWQATYVSVHRASGEFVALTLRDPTGAVRLEREFPVQEGSCVTLSQVIALVLERYFSRPELPQELATLATAPASHNMPASTDPLAPAASRPLASTTTNRPPQDSGTSQGATSQGDPRESHGGLGVQLALGLAATTAWIAPWIGFGLRFNRTSALQLGGGVDMLDHQESVETPPTAPPTATARAEVRRVPLSLTFSQRILSAEQFQIHLAGGLSGVVERGRTRGLTNNRSELRLVPGLTTSITAYFLSESAPLSPFVSGQAGLQFEALAPRFEVGGKAVLSPDAITVGGMVGVQLRF